MRDIDRIIIHCTATPRGRAVTVEEVRRWHVKGNKWSDIGYHYLVDIHGEINHGRPLGKIGAHCYGNNQTTIGVVYVGGTDKQGLPEDTMTKEQEAGIHKLIEALRIILPKRVTIHGHNEYSRKSCPSFIVKDRFK